MPNDPMIIPAPPVLCDHRAHVKVAIMFNEQVLQMSMPVGPVHVPACPVRPLVIMQARSLSNEPVGPTWMFDFEADKGRGVWVTFDSTIHDVPQSEATPLDAGTEFRSLDLSAGSEVELSDDGAPTLVTPPSFDADPEDEPSMVVDDEDDDEVPTE